MQFRERLTTAFGDFLLRVATWDIHGEYKSKRRRRSYSLPGVDMILDDQIVATTQCGDVEIRPRR